MSARQLEPLVKSVKRCRRISRSVRDWVMTFRTESDEVLSRISVPLLMIREIWRVVVVAKVRSRRPFSLATWRVAL